MPPSVNISLLFPLFFPLLVHTYAHTHTHTHTHTYIRLLYLSMCLRASPAEWKRKALAITAVLNALVPIAQQQRTKQKHIPPLQPFPSPPILSSTTTTLRTVRSAPAHTHTPSVLIPSPLPPSSHTNTKSFVHIHLAKYILCTITYIQQMRRPRLNVNIGSSETRHYFNWHGKYNIGSKHWKHIKCFLPSLRQTYCYKIQWEGGQTQISKGTILGQY